MFKRISWKRIAQRLLYGLPYVLFSALLGIHLGYVQNTTEIILYLQDQAKFNKSIAEDQREIVFDISRQCKEIVEVSETIQQDADQALEYAQHSQRLFSEAQAELSLIKKKLYGCEAEFKKELTACRAANKSYVQGLREAEDIIVYFQTQLQRCNERPI